MATAVAHGGPRDGERMDLPAPGEVVEVWGDWFTTREPPVRRGRKVYLYQPDETYRSRLTYVGEDVIWEDEEVTTDGVA